MQDIIRRLTDGKTNFVFLGETGSGKSEIAINFAVSLAQMGERPVHFFDMDMTKPLFRSRDVMEEMEQKGIVFHHEIQFYDAPTMVGGVNLHLKDDDCFVVLDVGGNDVGARAIGGFAPKVNQDNAAVYYVLNAYRPWSLSMEQIDGTLSAILGVSHISLGQIHMVNNPNNGTLTTPEEFHEGCKKMVEMVSPYREIEFACVKEDLYEEVKDETKGILLPIHLYLTYSWD